MNKTDTTTTTTTEPTTRTLSEIQTEYSQACTTLGDKQFRASLLNNEIQIVYHKLSELNAEAITLKSTRSTTTETAHETT